MMRIYRLGRADQFCFIHQRRRKRGKRWWQQGQRVGGSASDLMRRRPSARLLIVNPNNEVFLFRFEHKDGPLKGRSFWATPGGGLEANETFAQAAKRELFEETGFRTESMGAAVWRQEIKFSLLSGEYVLAEEQFFLVRVSDQVVSNENWTTLESELITKHRWWSAEALRSTDEVFFPENLPDVMQELLGR